MKCPVTGMAVQVEKATSTARISQLYHCESCDVMIHNEKDGFVIHGNIYVANPSIRGGLIGNNFPDTVPGMKFEITDVRESVLCRKCLLKALQLDFRTGEVYRKENGSRKIPSRLTNRHEAPNPDVIDV